MSIENKMITTTSEKFLINLGINFKELIKEDSDFIWGDTSNKNKLNFILGLVKHKFYNKKVLEFGTYRGSTTSSICSLLKGGQIYTVDCGFEELQEILVDENKEHNNKIKYSSYEVGEIYKKSGQTNVMQIIGNTKDHDVAKEIIDSGPFDLIYIDASHTYEGIKNDTEISFNCLNKNGIIIWDDYNSHWTGVNRFINELQNTKQLFYLQDSRYVIYVGWEL